MERLLLVESSAVAALGMSSLAREMGVNEVVLIDTINDILVALQTTRFKTVIISLSLKTNRERELIENIVKGLPTIDFLIFTERIDHLWERRMYRAGVKGIISKNATIEEMSKAIQQVRNKETYINSLLFARLLAKNKQAESFDQLTPREKEVANFLLNGKKNLEICTELSLRPSTVSTFKTKIFTKLNVQNLLELKNLMENWLLNNNIKQIRIPE